MIAVARSRKQPTTTPPAETPLRRTARKSRRRRIFEGAVLLTAVLLVAAGADRRAAGPTAGGVIAGAPERMIAARLRVASFNIHGGRGTDQRVDLDRVAETLHDIDFVALNEVYNGSLWRDENQAQQLGRRTGLEAIFAASERRWWHDYFGNGLLTAAPLARWQAAPLAGTQGKGFRNVIEADILVGTRPIHVLATHLDRTHDREDQLRIVLARFLALPEPAILLGDLNSTAADPQLAAALSRADVCDAVTTASHVETPHRIDWILSRGLEVVDGGVRDTGASDHPCVWVEFATTDEPAAEAAHDNNQPPRETPQHE